MKINEKAAKKIKGIRFKIFVGLFCGRSQSDKKVKKLAVKLTNLPLKFVIVDSSHTN